MCVKTANYVLGPCKFSWRKVHLISIIPAEVGCAQDFWTPWTLIRGKVTSIKSAQKTSHSSARDCDLQCNIEKCSLSFLVIFSHHKKIIFLVLIFVLASRYFSQSFSLYFKCHALLIVCKFYIFYIALRKKLPQRKKNY